MAGEQHTYDLIVIGGGPGGYVAAIRAAQLGMQVVLIERQALGGVCLNWGCIPTKTLLRSAELYRLMQRASVFGLKCDDVRFDFGKIIARSRQVADRLAKGVAFLLRKHRVQVVRGQGQLAGVGTVVVEGTQGRAAVTLQASHIILATGARPRPLPHVPFDQTQVLTSTDAMLLQEVPASLVIVGAGAVGVEFAYLYNAFGSKVTLVEMLPQVLPFEDREISEALQKSLTKQGIDLLIDSRVEGAEIVPGGVQLRIQAPDGQRLVQGAKVLVAIGVQGNIEQLGLDTAGVRSEGGFIPVDAYCRTNVAGIYAIGDVNGPPCLAHVASAEGRNTVEAIAGLDPPVVNRQNIPAGTYCQPQVASVGLTEQAARQAGHAVRVGRFPFRANGKALAAGADEGFVKVIFDADRDELLGVHMLGTEATELIAEVGLARTLETTHEEILRTVHAHPTFSEAFMEAVGQAYNEAIHI